MRRLLLLFLLFLPLNLFAQPVTGSPTIWEKAAAGRIPGVTHKLLYSANTATVSTGYESIWPESTLYSFLSANMSSPTISSGDANDTSAGTGARTVKVTCVDTNFAETTGTYTMNGQTGVSVTQACMTVTETQVMTAGSGGVNAGIIYVGTGTVTAGKPAVVHSYLATGANLSMGLIQAVPSGKTMLCRNGRFYTRAVTVISARYALSLSINKGLLGLAWEIGGGTNFQSELSLVKFPEKSQWKFEVLHSTASEVRAAIECLVINNTWLASAQNIL
jgi:hypothetical protein